MEPNSKDIATAEETKASVEYAKVEQILKILLDLAKQSTFVAGESRFHAALRERINKPELGDLVLECSSFGFDPDRIGIFVGRLLDQSHHLQELQPDDCHLWAVESLLTGKIENWGNSEWLALPTCELRNEVRTALHDDSCPT